MIPLSLSSELPPIDVRERETRLFDEMGNRGMSFLLVPDLVNVRWLTGFSGSAGSAIVDAARGEIHVLTDSRYKDQSREELSRSGSSAEVHMARSMSERSGVVQRVVGSGDVSVDANEVTAAFHNELAAHVSVVDCPTRTPFVELRRQKDAAELARIETAASIADSALQAVVASGLCGLSERDIKVRLEYEMARLGADGTSFDTIVATGANAAMPHHKPNCDLVRPGHMVIIDMGALVDGYHSDMTRTVKVGELSAEDERLFDLVKEAQSAGVRTVAAGQSASAIDGACRKVFEVAGVADMYVHGTGHGVGLDIHEEPFFHRDSVQKLTPGEVVTVEPGLYRVGVCGVRIEDLVMVTGSGCQVLSNTPKELSCPPSPRTI